MLVARERQRMHRRWIEAALLLSLAMTPIMTIVARTILVGTISAGSILAAALFATSCAGPAAAQQEQKFAQQSSTAQEEPGSATAKPSRRRGNKPAPAFEHDPDLDAQDQLAPSQVQQQLPEAAAGTRARPHTETTPRQNPAPPRGRRALAKATSSPAAASSPRIQATANSRRPFNRATCPTRKSIPIPAAR